jgi:hypothetical protein
VVNTYLPGIIREAFIAFSLDLAPDRSRSAGGSITMKRFRVAWLYAQVPNDFSVVQNDLGMVPNDFSPFPNDFSVVQNGFSPVPNDFSPVPNDFSVVQNDFSPVPNDF